MWSETNLEHILKACQLWFTLSLFLTLLLRFYSLKLKIKSIYIHLNWIESICISLRNAWSLFCECSDIVLPESTCFLSLFLRKLSVLTAVIKTLHVLPASVLLSICQTISLRLCMASWLLLGKCVWYTVIKGCKALDASWKQIYPIWIKTSTMRVK